MNIFWACIFTVIIETVLFLIFGYKKADDLVIIVLSNVITNVALNLLIMLFPDLYDLPWLIIAELIAIAVEYLIYRRAFGDSWRLFILTFFANVLSFFTGILFEEFILY